jgi:fibro-slime domain-containing protein
MVAALAAGCTFDASQLRAQPDGTVEPPVAPDAGAAGSGDDTASPPDAPSATGGSGGVAGTGGSGGLAGTGGSGGIGGAGGTGGGTAGSDAGVAGDGDVGNDTRGTTGPSLAAVWPPPSPPFVNVTNAGTGAYALGPEIDSSGDAGVAGGTSTPATQCAALLGVVRDFKMGNIPGGHPDFETAAVADDPGIVASTLGPDGKPVYSNPTGTTPSTHGKSYFDQWYNDVPGVNMSYVVALHLVNDANGTPTFAATLPNSSFFPLDNQGLGNQGLNHNFSFTTEIHTAFTYNGGEQFTFGGDDDLFVFINNQRVINKRGRHAQESQTVTIDSLGLTLGNVYDIAVFSAERHTTQSNFEIQTTLSFVNCGKVNNVIY